MAPVPPLLSSPRSSIDKFSHASIDSALKSLKSCSRRLQNVLSVHRIELQILDRLYYKGKNQHRSALFWKRVAEVRRYGSRVDGMGILDTLESLRCSFFDEAAQQNPKLLKGSWTRTPCVSYVVHVLERLSACYALVEKTQERLLQAYRSFTLAMQSGAFLQLVLTLAAIASRMHILMPEIQDILALGWAASHRSLQVLSPSCAKTLKPIGPHTAAERCDIPAGLQATSNSYEFDHEDLGSAITRVANAPCHMQKVDAHPMGSGVPSARVRDTVAVPSSVSVLAEDAVQWAKRVRRDLCVHQ